MAGFTNTVFGRGSFEFHIDTPDVAKRVREENDNARVITLQLDGDELDAALWGIGKLQETNIPVVSGKNWRNLNRVSPFSFA